MVDALVLSSRTVGSTDASLDVLACTAPALPSLAGFAAVEVSLNGKEFTRSGLVFEYGASGAARRVAARRAVLTLGPAVEVSLAATLPFAASSTGGTLMTVRPRPVVFSFGSGRLTRARQPGLRLWLQARLLLLLRCRAQACSVAGCRVIEWLHVLHADALRGPGHGRRAGLHRCGA